MRSKRSGKMKFVIPLLISAFLIQAAPTPVWAQPPERGGGGRGGPGGGEPRDHFYPHGKWFDSLPLAFATLIIAGATYYYYEGIYYQRMRDGYVVVTAPVGAVVTTIPLGCQPVIIDGVPYYTINGVTYRYTPCGYQVVPTPSVPPPTVVIVNNSVPGQKTTTVVTANNAANVQEASVTNASNSFIVNIPNSKGGYNAVTLTRSGNGFIGPQSEYYTEFPTIEQLKVMYAK